MKKIQIKQLRTSGLPLHETLTTNQVELLTRLVNKTQDASLLHASISVNKAYEDSVDFLETKSGIGINVTNYEYFRFADTSVESICAFNWGDNIGLSRDQAAAVTNANLGTTFRNNTEITSFDELSYFSGLNTIPGNTSTNGAFQGCTSLKSVTLPTSVNFIGQYAFEGDTSLTDVKNTGSVNTVNSYAFKDCTSLRNALFSNVSVIGNNSFINCLSLDSSLTFNSLYNIGTGAFYNSAIKEIEAPLLTSIPSASDASTGTFGNCKNLIEFNAPNIEGMGAYAFYDDSSLKHIVSSPTSLGGHCCENCEDLESIELKDVTSMTSVNNFKNCKSLTSIGDGLNSVDGTLGEYNFAGCTSLKDVSLGAGITDIGEHCFEGNSSLESVDFQGASCIIEPYAFADCSCLCNLHEVNGIKRIERNAFKNNNIDLNLGELNGFKSLEYADLRNVNIKDVISEDLNKIKIIILDNAYTSVMVEESADPHWSRGGDLNVIDDILNTYGSYVIDEENKTYAQLDPSNHGYFIDGTPYTGTYGNSFRRFPKVYYKVDTTKELRISDFLFDSDAKHWDETWIGTYKGSVQNGKLLSRPNMTTRQSMTMTAFWNAAQALGLNYGLVNYFDFCEYNALHLCKFGNANSEQTMGPGLQNAGSGYYTHTTGSTASLGDGTGSAQYLSTAYTMNKLFGIEDLAGSTWEFRPNIRFSGANSIVYEGNIVSNGAEGIRTFTRKTGLYQSYIKEMSIGNDFDLIPTNGGGSASTYWCDGAWSSSSGELLIVGGRSNIGSLCGLSASASDDAFSSSYAHFGARLAFRGDISAYILITGSQMANLH